VIAQELAQIELQRMNDELKLAKEQAESGDLLKTAFMNNISHEIRTPLNGILGFSQLMADPDLTHDERVQYLSIVKSSSNRLMNTVTDYMDISLLASGNQDVESTRFNLRDLLDEIYYHFQKIHYLGLLLFWDH
jgi:signal transduction histidine kinase